MDNKTTIVLIRHGQTVGNVRRLYYGASDLSLTKQGEEEILGLHVAGIYPRTERYFTSGMIRTNQTMEIICPGQIYLPLSCFSEFDFGEFEQMTHEELQHIPEYVAWIEDKTGNTRCPKGESRNEFMHRVHKGFLRLLRDTKGETSTLVCHGGVIGVIMCILFPDQGSFIEWTPNNGHGYAVTIENEQFSFVRI